MQKNGEKMKKLKSIIPGTAVCAVIAAAATLTGGISIGGFSFELIGAPVIAILLGMILTLVFPKLASLTSLSGGIKFTSKKILQWAVVILGFSLNLSTIAQVGAKSLPVVSILIVIGLSLFINKTKSGRAMLAVSEDKDAAQLMGININRTIQPAPAVTLSCQVVRNAVDR